MYQYRPQPKTSFAYLARPPQRFFFNEFITPLALSVFEITKEISGDSLEAVGPGCHGALRGMEYVTDLEQFHIEDFFEFPFEMLKNRKGDCEDFANLLTSLLAGCGLEAATVYGAVSLEEKTYAHAWTEVGQTFIEATDPEYRPKLGRPDFYHPEMAITWGYDYPVGYGVSWIGNPNSTRRYPKLTPEELKRLHEKLRGGG